MGRLYALIALFFLLIANSPSGISADMRETCPVCMDQWLKSLIENYHRLEEGYVFYRWSEAKIRRLYYEDLWQIRNETIDPLSPENRQQGNVAEAQLEKIIRSMESESQAAANGFYILLTQIEAQYDKAGSCCDQSNFHACIQELYEPVLSVMDRIRTEFDRLYEREREIRDDVVQAVSGPLGLYRDEALESSDAHQDLYVRYEQEREPQRYEENRVMMTLFLEFYRYVYLDNKFATCCLRC